MRTLACLILFACTSFLPAPQSVTFYVSPTGSAGNPGTQSAPFATPDQAFQALKNIKGPLNAAVVMMAGYYSFPKSLLISGNGPDASRNIMLTTDHNQKVVFSGGVQLKNNDFHLVTDAAILRRLPAGSRGKVYQVNLKAMGITDYGKSLPHGYKLNVPANLELFYNGSPMTIARYPNAGTIPIGNVQDHGSIPRNGEHDNRGAVFACADPRMSRWTTANHAWIGGYLSYGYSDDYVKVATVDPQGQAIHLQDPAWYGVYATADESNDILKNGESVRGFYIYNLLEELDQPGEYYLDPDSGILYFMPPDNGLAQATVEVSVLDQPIVRLSHISNVTIQGIAIECGRGQGIYAEGTDHIVVQHCPIYDLGTVGIQLASHEGSGNNTHFTIQHCSVYNTGTGGIILDGGDRKNLVPADNTATNCELFNYSRIDKTYSPAFFMDGVRNHITHCYIHDAQCSAIQYYGNDQDISYNHINRVATLVTDAGAVCTGRDMSSTGNVIQCNFFENIQNTTRESVCAIYLDDASEGMQVNCNVFYKCSTPGTYNFGVIHVNGGSDNTFRDNYFIDCNKAFSNSQWPDKVYRAAITDAGHLQQYYSKVDIRSSVYQQKYPQLARLTDTVHLATRQNYTYNSLCWNVSVYADKTSYVNTNVYMTSQDPGFKDAARKDFTLLNAPPQLAQAQGWQPVPFAQIGPQAQ
ncbi:right-handed parallel beta-helix repeat-containing protein [Dinghuibacter silviterrae]|uniref:Parallel beta helix pectate lyase-like protein n=1 Tax=Dinghuibacter silviterrae TaxID=1539049 RepID=A0A4R8DTV7_9BACT|nr:right-handed parallel beta-helix repeat-containing protein [Dinghuibacter silviterrae]TDX01772.1 parallel beta helix pectate lyase-like protein [Dinghuibacter silviterrae]